MRGSHWVLDLRACCFVSQDSHGRKERSLFLCYQIKRRLSHAFLSFTHLMQKLLLLHITHHVLPDSWHILNADMCKKDWREACEMHITGNWKKKNKWCKAFTQYYSLEGTKSESRRSHRTQTLLFFLLPYLSVVCKSQNKSKLKKMGTKFCKNAWKMKEQHVCSSFLLTFSQMKERYKLTVNFLGFISYFY